MPTILQADLTYFEGRLQSDVVVHVGRNGLIEQISRNEKGVDSVRREGVQEGPVLELETTNPGEFALPRARRKHRLRGRALLPGFTNAHSHSFQRLLRGRTEHRPPGRKDSNFWTWRDAMYRVSEALSPEDIEAVAAFSFMEMLQAGFTHVVEFHYLHHQLGGHPYEDPTELSRRILAAAEFAGIGITLLPVAYQRNAHDQPTSHPQKRFIHNDVSDYIELLDRVREHSDHGALRPVQVGIAAHSVRTLDKDYLSALGSLGQAGGYRCHAHVAEQPEEIRSCVAEHRLRPLEVLADAGLLSDRFTAVHATHLSEDEIVLLGSSGSGACICPTTERNLGDGLPKLTELLDAGCALSIGSDSQVRIDPFAEIRALEDGERLRTQSRSVLTNDEGSVAPVLIDVGTRGGRSATGLALGGIEVGQRADLVGVDLENAHLDGVNLGSEGQAALLAALVLGGYAGQVRDAWVGGRHVISEGRHLRWEAAQEGYMAVARRVWA